MHLPPLEFLAASPRAHLPSSSSVLGPAGQRSPGTGVETQEFCSSAEDFPVLPGHFPSWLTAFWGEESSPLILSHPWCAHPRGVGTLTIGSTRVGLSPTTQGGILS